MPVFISLVGNCGGSCKFGMGLALNSRSFFSFSRIWKENNTYLHYLHHRVHHGWTHFFYFLFLDPNHLHVSLFEWKWHRRRRFLRLGGENKGNALVSHGVTHLKKSRLEMMPYTFVSWSGFTFFLSLEADLADVDCLIAESHDRDLRLLLSGCRVPFSWSLSCRVLFVPERMMLPVPVSWDLDRRRPNWGGARI